MLAADGARLYKTQTFTSSSRGPAIVDRKPASEEDLQPSWGGLEQGFAPTVRRR